MNKPLIGEIRPFYEWDDWNVYSEQLDQFLDVNDIPSEKYTSFLLGVCIGPYCYKVLRDLCHPVLPKEKSFSELCALLQRHFVPRIAVFRERIKFYTAKQESYEDVKAWYARIKSLSVDCRFGEILPAVLLDRFITGLRSGAILDRLCEETETVTLQEVLEIAVNKEAALEDPYKEPPPPPPPPEIVPYQQEIAVCSGAPEPVECFKPERRMCNKPFQPPVTEDESEQDEEPAQLPQTFSFGVPIQENAVETPQPEAFGGYSAPMKKGIQRKLCDVRPVQVSDTGAANLEVSSAPQMMEKTAELFSDSAPQMMERSAALFSDPPARQMMRKGAAPELFSAAPQMMQRTAAPELFSAAPQMMRKGAAPELFGAAPQMMMKGAAPELFGSAPQMIQRTAAPELFSAAPQMMMKSSAPQMMQRTAAPELFSAFKSAPAPAMAFGAAPEMTFDSVQPAGFGAAAAAFTSAEMPMMKSMQQNTVEFTPPTPPESVKDVPMAACAAPADPPRRKRGCRGGANRRNRPVQT